VPICLPLSIPLFVFPYIIVGQNCLIEIFVKIHIQRQIVGSDVISVRTLCIVGHLRPWSLQSQPGNRHLYSPIGADGSELIQSTTFRLVGDASSTPPLDLLLTCISGLLGRNVVGRTLRYGHQVHTQDFRSDGLLALPLLPSQTPVRPLPLLLSLPFLFPALL
jgi:hypothetical protein